MILSDTDIRVLCERSDALQDPLIEPYEPENVQPASIDVRLGNQFLVSRLRSSQLSGRTIDLGDRETLIGLMEERWVNDGEAFVIRPQQCVLGATKECVNIPSFLKASIEGKSSVGRLFLFIHCTAGYIDPGFCGNVTIEMFNANPHPIIVRPGLLIAQLAFHRLTSPSAKPYNGRYQNDLGPSPSRYDGGQG